MDGRDWMFISVGKTIRLLDWDWDWCTGSWVATATFDVIVETGNEGKRETISHTLRCTDPVPPEPPRTSQAVPDRSGDGSR